MKKFWNPFKIWQKMKKNVWLLFGMKYARKIIVPTISLCKNPWELLTALGDYNVNDDYFVFGLYGYINSFNYVDDKNSPFNIGELADWLLDNKAYWVGLGIKNNIDE